MKKTAPGASILLLMILVFFDSASPARSAAEAFSEKEPFVGAWVCDYFARRTWDQFWKEVNPVEVFWGNGFGWVKAAVTTVSNPELRSMPLSSWHALPWKDSYWSSREYAEQILKEASRLGLRLNLVLYLSHESAHSGKQSAPPEWAGLSVKESAVALEAYCYGTTKYFKERGLHIELYDIGNEIEWGILNFRPNERVHRPPNVDIMTNMEYMKSHVWNIESVLLKAAIRGVKRADPEAEIVLHVNSLATRPENRVAKSFFKSMVEQGVDFDYAGLSLPYLQAVDYPFPQPYFASKEFNEVVDSIAALKKKVIISEFNYPHEDAAVTFPPSPEYPLSPEGQAKWVRNLLDTIRKNDNIAGAYYWAPEYFMNMSYGATPEAEIAGLFANDAETMPAMKEFRYGMKEIISSPLAPNGPSVGSIEAEHHYSAEGSSSNLGHTLEHQFDWVGDGSALSAWGTGAQAGKWAKAGVYNVRARSRCAQDTAIVSQWSPKLPVAMNAGPNSITVTITPQGAVAAGAVWSIDAGATWRSSGATAGNLSPGSYALELKDVSGWTKPPSRKIDLAAGEIKSLSPAYKADVVITASDASASESHDKGQFTITRSGDASNALKLTYAISGSALNGKDYGKLRGTVTIKSNFSSAIINIRPKDDKITEGDETVTLTLPNGENATVTITDND